MKKAALLVVIGAFAGSAGYAMPTRVTDLTVPEATDTTFTVQWTVPLTSPSYSLAENDIRISTVPINNLNWSSRPKAMGIPVPGPQGSIQRVVINGATPLSTFYIALKVRDSSGEWSILSNLASVTTPGRKARRVQFGWRPNSEPDLWGYNIYYGPSTRAYTNRVNFPLNVLIWATNTVPEITTNELNVVVTNMVDRPENRGWVSNLVDGGTYYFALTAYNTAGIESDFSAELSTTLTTPRIVPTIVWSRPADIVYGTKLSSVQLNAVAQVNGTNIPGAYVYGPTVGTALPAGDFQLISVMFLPSSDAFTATSAEVRINVKRAPLLAAAYNRTKVYGRAMPQLTGNVFGLVNGDTIASLGVSFGLSTTADASSPVGNYPITLTATGTPANYTMTLSNAVLSITPATVTLTAHSKWKYRWTPNPPLTGHSSGLVNGDTIDEFTPPVVLTTTATTDSPPATYPITISQTANPNYIVRYVNSTLRVVNPTVPLVVVTPAYATFPVGTDQQFTATLLQTNGSKSDITGQVLWNSSTQSVAQIDTNGVLSALSVGTATISATYGSTVGSTTVTIVTNAPVLAAYIPELEVSPMRITSISPAVQGHVILTVSGPSGHDFWIERSNDLLSWESIYTARFSDEGEASYMDEVAGQDRLFYRVRREAP